MTVNHHPEPFLVPINLVAVQQPTSRSVDEEGVDSNHPKSWPFSALAGDPESRHQPAMSDEPFRYDNRWWDRSACG